MTTMTQRTNLVLSDFNLLEIGYFLFEFEEELLLKCMHVPYSTFLMPAFLLLLHQRAL